MTTITHRVGRSRNLTPNEVDANFDRLNADLLALGEQAGFAGGNLDGGTAESIYAAEQVLDGGGP